jgi:FMN phosphatase YigB (HAD superfamily)
VQGAKTAGMKTVWLKRKNRSKENATVVPNKIIDDLTELPKILETLFMQ